MVAHSNEHVINEYLSLRRSRDCAMPLRFYTTGLRRLLSCWFQCSCGALKIWPVFYNLYLSFTRYELFEPPRFVGLKNYKYVFTNKTAFQSIINTLLFTIEAVPLGTALALIIAKLLDQSIRGRVFLRTLYYLPVVSSVVVSAMIWRWIYSPQHGLLNYFLGIVGIPAQHWLNDPNLALISLVIVTIWGSIGSNMVIFLAGLQDIPRDVIEAARVDGASPIQSFLRITVPLMRPVTLRRVTSPAHFAISGLIFCLTQAGLQRTHTRLEVYQNSSLPSWARRAISVSCSSSCSS